jgi:hypothetical protein
MRIHFLLLMTVAVVGALRTEPAARQLQQTLNYRASYRADFQHYSDSLCSGASPVLLVSCKGSSMTILNTSDDTILCQPRGDLSLFPNATETVFQCENTCVDSDCEKVYRYEMDVFDPISGPFGSIVFQCEGNTIDEIDAVFVYRGSNGGYCAGTVERRNYHIGRLGVSCPVGDGSSNREYVYDDTFVECRSPGSYVLDLNPIEAGPDVYACVNGKKCNAECFFNFSDFFMEADVQKFYEPCVESLVDKTPYPTMPLQVAKMLLLCLYRAIWRQILALSAPLALTPVAVLKPVVMSYCALRMKT